MYLGCVDDMNESIFLIGEKQRERKYINFLMEFNFVLGILVALSITIDEITLFVYTKPIRLVAHVKYWQKRVEIYYSIYFCVLSLRVSRYSIFFYKTILSNIIYLFTTSLTKLKEKNNRSSSYGRLLAFLPNLLFFRMHFIIHSIQNYILIKYISGYTQCCFVPYFTSFVYVCVWFHKAELHRLKKSQQQTTEKKNCY